MSLNTAFRLSFYLTMGLACCCLTAGEALFLNWMGYLLPAVLAFITLAYFAEGRWQLSLGASNVVGLVVAVGVGAWAYLFMPRDEKDFLEIGLPWPAGMLPYLGPLLMILLVLKLFQPKRGRDFWALESIGLVAVALGCILSADSLFGLLLAAYMAGVIWCLAMNYLVQRQAANLAPSPTVALFTPSASSPGIPWRRAGLGQVARWGACIMLLGFGLFLAAPRQTDAPWQPDRLSNGEYAVGIGIENSIDLGRSGVAELSDDIAFELSARSKHGPVADLPPQSRCFVEFLEFYYKGQWLNWNLAQAKSKRGFVVAFVRGSYKSRSGDPKGVPDNISDDSVYLRFRVPGQMVASMPLFYPPGDDDALLGLDTYVNDEPVQEPFFQRLQGLDLICTFPFKRSGRFYVGEEGITRVPSRSPAFKSDSVFSYGQVIRARTAADLFPARSLEPDHLEYLLRQQTPVRILDWTRSLVPRLPELTWDERRLDDIGNVEVQHRARVASALCDYLALSGNYRYSLTLRRQDKEEPTVDFLFNVKEGHCTRFAGGLALMLRAVGIPSRIVMGFRGLEGGANGEYRVRMRQAHSWVQALVKVPGSDDWHWQTLDPTPPSAARDSPASGLDLTNIWQNYILDFTAARQAKSQRALLAKLGSGSFWLVVGACVGGVVAVGRLRPLWRTFDRSGRSLGRAKAGLQEPHVLWYQRFLQVLAKRCQLQPALGQTPREFGCLATALLARRSLPESLVKAPQRIVDLLYGLRFGGRAVTAVERNQADCAVAELEGALGARALPINTDTNPA
ncbi:MAG: transglutaminase domain-containing protein [Planctomycetes bacterium]|nr:transglutaminase domain-containing protein [Planctomycetota bacterium]